MTLTPARSPQPVAAAGEPQPGTTAPAAASGPQDTAPVATSSRGPVILAGGVLAGAALVVALRALAAEPVAGTPLADAGPVTDVGLALTQVAQRMLAVLTVGSLLLAVLLVRAADPGAPQVRRRSLRWATAAACGWAAVTPVHALFTLSEVLAVPVWAVPVTALPTFAELGPGRAAGGTVLLTLLVGVLASSPRPALAPAALITSLTALVLPQVLSGHSATAPDHVQAVVVLSTHVLVATAWVGGLVALVLHARRSPALLVAASRFSVLALVCFVATVGTGAVGTLTVLGRVPSVAELTSTPYGRLLLAKTALLVVLGAAGWWHRRRTLPRLAAGTRRPFVRFAAAEVVVLAVAMVLAVVLASTPPDAPSGPPAGGTAAGPPGATAAPDGPETDALGAAGAQEDMSGHDHGPLTVSVLIDAQRYHVAGPVQPGQRVTVFNSAREAVALTAADGTFDLTVAAGSLTTFAAPSTPGSYEFGGAAGYSDVLVVAAP